APLLLHDAVAAPRSGFALGRATPVEGVVDAIVAGLVAVDDAITAERPELAVRGTLAVTAVVALGSLVALLLLLHDAVATARPEHAPRSTATVAAAVRAIVA